MYWQENPESEVYAVPDDVVDVRFRIDCACVPMDHAWALSAAIIRHLPWFADETFAGLHIIHGADSGNGWERPQEGAAPLYLSRRTRLVLRLPKRRVDDALDIKGTTMDIAGNPLTLGEGTVRELSIAPTLYSRYVNNADELDEDAFLEWAVSELKALDLTFKKVLSGKSSSLATPDGPLSTRSLMVSDLPKPDAVRLQQHGIGPGRAMGCGLFIPQKTV